MKAAKHFRDLDVYQNAMAQVMRVFELTKDFGADERFALTDQMRRSHARSARTSLKHGESAGTGQPLLPS
jgi:four helix bundle protein